MQTLWIGAELIDKNGNVVLVEQLYRENLGDESVKVYNFQVEDYHTYFVSENCILVHNAGDLYARGKYRKSTHEKMKAEAPRDADGNMICPTCGKKKFQKLLPKMAEHVLGMMEIIIRQLGVSVYKK